jgi:SAM-dependent methyltransferase
MKAAIKRAIVYVVPLRIRKALAIWLNRQTWLGAADRAYWATELLADFATRDVNAYHKFLWAHHLAYAETYEIGLRFGYENLNQTRKVLFAELPERFEHAGVGTVATVQSVLEIGCSLGYLLRYMETEVFPRATRLEGIDIDAHAITEGATHLAKLGSKVKLHHGDMESMETVLRDTRFDFVLGSGVLLYLDENAARGLVAKMLRHTRKLLAITALAHPETDNASLEISMPRTSDGTWIHNVDRMIAAGGGKVVARRWEGGRLVDGNTIYFLYAVPSSSGASA